MKYLVSWTGRPGLSLKDAQESMKVFEKWAPDPSITFHQFLQRADGRGGYAVVETDNPTAMLRDAMTFGLWFEFSTELVLDMLEAAPTLTEVTTHLSEVLS
ncbi:MAG TPA: DUF3303 family protein [Acidimicrobiales bacterium]|nr:DUF3303 family protein [Acidimicrobiales bacterium]